MCTVHAVHAMCAVHAVCAVHGRERRTRRRRHRACPATQASHWQLPAAPTPAAGGRPARGSRRADIRLPGCGRPSGIWQRQCAGAGWEPAPAFHLFPGRPAVHDPVRRGGQRRRRRTRPLNSRRRAPPVGAAGRRWRSLQRFHGLSHRRACDTRHSAGHPTRAERRCACVVAARISPARGGGAAGSCTALQCYAKMPNVQLSAWSMALASTYLFRLYASPPIPETLPGLEQTHESYATTVLRPCATIQPHFQPVPSEISYIAKGAPLPGCLARCWLADRRSLPRGSALTHLAPGGQRPWEDTCPGAGAHAPRSWRRQRERHSGCQQHPLLAHSERGRPGGHPAR